MSLISNVINEDIAFSKSPLDLRNQRCYAVKVSSFDLSSVFASSAWH